MLVGRVDQAMLDLTMLDMHGAQDTTTKNNGYRSILKVSVDSQELQLKEDEMQTNGSQATTLLTVEMAHDLCLSAKESPSRSSVETMKDT
jgi:hypothetical protein